MLSAITFSGPDCETAVDDLVSIQRKHPFVEFGVLWSANKAGSQRYPTRDWIENATSCGLVFSLHLCGTVARNLFELGVTPDIPGKPSRVQVNCNTMVGKPAWYYAARKIEDKIGTVEFVVQTNDHHGAYWVGRAVSRGLRFVPLFDRSGGLGKSPDVWPHPLPGIKCGYAGGIAPHNAVEVVRRLTDLSPYSPFWIDMESGVRSSVKRQGALSNYGDFFSIDKVMAVIEDVGGYVKVADPHADDPVVANDHPGETAHE